MQITSMILYTKEAVGNRGKVRVSQNPEPLRGANSTHSAFVTRFVDEAISALMQSGLDNR